jgi:hypothetical protein
MTYRGLESELRKHEMAWKSKPLLPVYRDWYDLIRLQRTAVAGPTVELGDRHRPLQGVGTGSCRYPMSS